MKTKLFTWLNLHIVLVLVVIISACTSQKTDVVVPDAELSSFGLIQDKILTPNCAISGCHSSTTDKNYIEHQLILTKGVAYKNLFNVACANKSATLDNLLRVKPFKSLESLLAHKLNFDVAHHGGKSYGSPMPLGGTPLYVGQIEYIRRWIEAGAPEKGVVADASLLDDKTTSADPLVFTALAPPPAGMGLQLKVDKFDIKPNFEREIFVRRSVGNAQAIYINRIQAKSRINSHHLVLYDFRDKSSLPNLNEVRDLRSPSTGAVLLGTILQMSNHIFLGGGTDANSDYVFPEGTAIMLPANSSIDLNPHYFNKTTDKTLFGESYVNLYTVDKSKVKNVVQMLDLNNTSFTIPAQTRKTIITDFTEMTNNGPIKIVMLTSHMHKWGEKYMIRIKGGSRNGQLVYETADWEHPAIINFATEPIVLQKGEGLTSEVTYYNPTNAQVRFGLTSEEEMNIIFGYYYEVK